MKKLVLRIRWGGLGDHLYYSPIPRVAKQTHGYDKVFISNYSDLTNKNVKRLVWEYNPFVDGFVDEDAPWPSFATVEEGKNLLDAIVDFVGLPDDGVRFREPEIYYKPNKIEYLQDSILYDPNYKCQQISHVTSQQAYRYFQENNIMPNYQIKKFASFASSISGVPEIKDDSIEQYCDMIFSCKLFIGISGSVVLASALNKRSVALYSGYIKPMFFHSKTHQYVKLG